MTTQEMDGSDRPLAVLSDVRRRIDQTTSLSQEDITPAYVIFRAAMEEIAPEPRNHSAKRGAGLVLATEVLAALAAISLEESQSLDHKLVPPADVPALVCEPIATPTLGAIVFDGPTYGSIDSFETYYVNPEDFLEAINIGDRNTWDYIREVQSLNDIYIHLVEHRFSLNEPLAPEIEDLGTIIDSYFSLPDKIRPPVRPDFYFSRIRLSGWNEVVLPFTTSEPVELSTENDWDKPDHRVDLAFKGDDVFITNGVDKESLGIRLSADKQSLRAQLTQYYVTRFILENDWIQDDYVRQFSWFIAQRYDGYEWIVRGSEYPPAANPLADIRQTVFDAMIGKEVPAEKLKFLLDRGLINLPQKADAVPAKSSNDALIRSEIGFR